MVSRSTCPSSGRSCRHRLSPKTCPSRTRSASSTQQFTVSEVGCEVILTDRSVRRTPEAMKARAGRFLGNAMRRKKESDLLTLFSGFSRDVGGAGSAFDPADLSITYTRLSAGAETNQDEPAPLPYAAVLHPFHYHDVLTSAATMGTLGTPDEIPTGLTQRLTEDYFVGTLYNVPIDLHPLIDIDTSDDAVGAVFSKEALLLIETSVSMKREMERDIHLRAWDIVITSEYGTGELEDQFGFAVTADATVPA